MVISFPNFGLRAAKPVKNFKRNFGSLMFVIKSANRFTTSNSLFCMYVFKISYDNFKVIYQQLTSVFINTFSPTMIQKIQEDGKQ